MSDCPIDRIDCYGVCKNRRRISPPLSATTKWDQQTAMPNLIPSSVCTGTPAPWRRTLRRTCYGGLSLSHTRIPHVEQSYSIIPCDEILRVVYLVDWCVPLGRARKTSRLKLARAVRPLDRVIRDESSKLEARPLNEDGRLIDVAPPSITN